MPMITFPHIEDYLEVLGGFRQILNQGQSLGPASLFAAASGPISLARYDIGIVQSMGSHTVTGGSLTDRQAQLAIKLVGKYRKQFRKIGVDVEAFLANPQFRNNIRIIDRTRQFLLRNNKIVAKFPYDKAIIALFGAAVTENKGSCEFDREHREWHLAPTAGNINWAVTVGQNNEFIIDPELAELQGQITQLEKTPYRIELDIAVDRNIGIINAANSMIDYINQHIGGLGQENLVKLVDYAPILGYTVSREIQDTIKNNYGDTMLGLLLNRQCHYYRESNESDPTDLLQKINDYAAWTDRYPIYVYEPDVGQQIKKTLWSMFDESEIIDITTLRNADRLDNSKLKCVYFSKVKKFMRDRIPVLISSNAMLYGAEKQLMLQLAEKVVYYTPTTLNKEAKPIASQINY